MKKQINRVHFVGIGGIGMSSLAQHLLALGYTVSGSDRAENSQTEKLRKLGATVVVPHGRDIFGAQLVVRTSAVGQDNSEVQIALQRGIPVILREELLGRIFNGFDCRIAVCGTHGKTTVTAMIHRILERCGVPHAAFIGGEYGKNNYFGGSGTVVAEACEFNRSFLHLHPTLCVCLNVEFDHPDCYRDRRDVENAFCTLFGQSDKVLLCAEQGNLWQGAELFGRDGEICARNVTVAEGRAKFDLYCDGEEVCSMHLSVCGVHNVNNALAALAVAKNLGLPLLQAAHAVATFGGVDRRWTEQTARLHVVCDYAHHPTEIAAAVATAKSLCKGRIICVFQPHTYSRTAALFDDFATCFSGVETVYLPVYSAREKPQRGATSFQLFKYAKSIGNNAKYFASFQRAANYLLRHATQNDLVVLVGAGDVDKMVQYLQ